MRDELIETWRTNNRINLFLIDKISAVGGGRISRDCSAKQLDQWEGVARDEYCLLYQAII